jgi:hypothetical protein
VGTFFLSILAKNSHIKLFQSKSEQLFLDIKRTRVKSKWHKTNTSSTYGGLNKKTSVVATSQHNIKQHHKLDCGNRVTDTNIRDTFLEFFE